MLAASGKAYLENRLRYHKYQALEYLIWARYTHACLLACRRNVWPCLIEDAPFYEKGLAEFKAEVRKHAAAYRRIRAILFSN
jgi:hypothetical protein